MKVIKEFKEWFLAKLEARREKNAVRKHANLEKESQRVVQVMEFDGKVYLCYCDVPLVPSEGLGGDVAGSLAIARETWVKYKEAE